MSCLYDELLEPYYCEADWNCKDCPNWIEEDKRKERNNEAENHRQNKKQNTSNIKSGGR